MNNLSNKILAMSFRLSMAIVVLYSASFTLFAAEDSRYWQRIGPEGSNINHFVTHQKQADIIYASSKSYAGSKGTYFKSINAGKSWVALADVPNSISNKPFNISTGLAVDSQNPHILYAYSVDGLLKSTDNAMHWQQLGGDVNMDTASFFALNPFVTQSLRVLTNTEDHYEFGMAVSENSGQQWSVTGDRVHLFFEEKSAEILLETSDSKNPNILYGVSYSPGGFLPIYPPLPEFLYKSINAGLDWVNITPTEKAYRAYSGKSLILTDNSDTLYATFSASEWGGGEQTLTSHNGGKDWETLGTPSENLVDFNLSRVYLDPTDAQILYANVYPANLDDRSAYPNRIAKSYNAGKTWQVIDVSPYQTGQIVVNTHNNQWLLMNSWQGVLRSENGGINWMPSNTGMKELGGSFAVARDDNAVMYAVIRSVNYRTIDGGQHWELITTKGPVEGACSGLLIINPKDNREIICSSSSGLSRSKDAGDHWDVFKLGRNKAVYANDGKTIYTYSRGLISKTIDSGQSWYYVNKITDKLDPHSPTYLQTIPFKELPIIDPVNQNILYSMVTINHSRRLYKSIDHGKRWQLLVANTLPGTRKLLLHPLNPQRLIYIMGSEKTLLSDDGGESWEEISMKLETAAYSVPDIMFDPNYLQGLYGAVNGGVYHSIDLGVTWDLIDKGLGDGSMLTLVPASKDIFSSSSTGLFRLSEKIDVSSILDCLFQWAELTYPELFSPGSSNSQQWGGYTYRYYQKSNTYLGFFNAQEVHLNRADLSSKIDAVGTVDFYQRLTGCH